MGLSIYSPLSFSPIGQGLFGLKRDQMVADPALHCSNWYLKTGERLSWGDLSVENVRRIGREIDPNELFVIVEQGMYSALLQSHLRLDISNLQRKALAQYATFIIARDTLLHINPMGVGRNGSWRGIPCTNITRWEAEDVLKAANAK